MNWQQLRILSIAIIPLVNQAQAQDDWPADAIHPIRAVSTNYLRDIEPIFKKHCIECHGESEQSSGLRLDTAAFGKKGGASQRPVFDGTLMSNEIYQRVSATDPAYRMPKGKEALSAHEIEQIRQWVEEGCPAQDPEPAAMSPSPVSSNFWWEIWFDRADALAQWTQKNPYSNEFLYIGLGLMVLMLVWQRFPKIAWLRNDQQVTLLIFFAALFLIFQQNGTANFERDRADQLQKQHERYVEEQQKLQRPPNRSLNGKPPVAHRLQHPNALARTYYRGNCERNDKLFNHGNYCTNTFEVRLQTSSGSPLHYQDTVPAEGLWAHFEIIRSPGSTPLLYKDDQMSRVFVSTAPSDDVDHPQVSIPMKVLESGERWGVDIPMTDCPAHDGELNRTFYVSNGAPPKIDHYEQTHYAFQIVLSIADGKIAADSDVWMGCLFTPPIVTPPQANRLPFCEWFDWRPLPVIVGENTTDLKILGVLDHRPELGNTSPDPATPQNDNPPPQVPGKP